MAATKKYEATITNVSGASYEVRLEDGVISVSNITGIDQGTLYAKKGAAPVKIEGATKNLDVQAGITSVEDAADAIKSILYVLNIPEGEEPSTEAIQGAVSIGGTQADGLTFEQIVNIA